jgi:hypothetical protein
MRRSIGCPEKNFQTGCLVLIFNLLERDSWVQPCCEKAFLACLIPTVEAIKDLLGTIIILIFLTNQVYQLKIAISLQEFQHMAG